MGEAAQRAGSRFALEHFGTGRDPQSLLSDAAARFHQDRRLADAGPRGQPELQQRVRAIVQAANKRNIQTVAERIEDANTMAVVWQLGVQYIQGYFVHAPEEVVLKS